MAEASDLLSLYIAYERYLPAYQIGRAISQLDRMYDAVYAGYTQCDARDIPDQARMRIETLQTGNSLFAEFVEGISTAVQVGTPVVTIPAAMGIMALIGRVLISATKGLLELRKTFWEGEKLKAEAREARKRGWISDTLQRESLDDATEGAIPAPAKQVITEAAIRFVTVLEFAPNITLVRINKTTIVDKRGHHEERQSP